MVSHELRTPLTSIKGALSLIKTGAIGDIPDKLKRMLDIAYNNSDRLIRLINDILDIEKIESGKMDFQIAPINLVALLEQAIEANKEYGANRGVSFALVTEVHRAMIDGDHDRLMQVLANLMSNAVKFSPEGGIVGITLSRHESGYRIEVADTGPGIPLEFRDKIFEKFSQADSTNSRQKGGTGLGLNISKAIVETLGGRIGFESEVGKGATFYFDLPMRSEEPAPIAAAPSQAPRRILICEDDADNAALIEELLHRNGFDADIARNATEAKAFLGKRSYDAMTLDIGLPDKHGFTLLKEIREDQDTRTMPIIVASGQSRRANDLEGSFLGIFDWIQKPINNDRLATSVRLAVHPPTAGQTRILHVEDDPDIIYVVTGIVGDFAEVTAARTFAEAADILAKEKFDLILLDLGLPDRSGEELLEVLKTTLNEWTPVIVFSSADISPNLARKFTATLVKSSTSNRSLLDTVRSAIENARYGKGPNSVS